MILKIKKQQQQQQQQEGYFPKQNVFLCISRIRRKKSLQSSPSCLGSVRHFKSDFALQSLHKIILSDQSKQDKQLVVRSTTNLVHKSTYLTIKNGGIPSTIADAYRIPTLRIAQVLGMEWMEALQICLESYCKSYVQEVFHRKIVEFYWSIAEWYAATTTSW